MDIDELSDWIGIEDGMISEAMEGNVLAWISDASLDQASDYRIFSPANSHYKNNFKTIKKFLPTNRRIIPVSY
jgi:hypothetical protein